MIFDPVSTEIGGAPCTNGYNGYFASLYSAQFKSSVGKDTSYLVVGENPGESKILEALKWQTKQLNEQELLSLLDR